ncbi:alpha/beta hydrolase [Paenibacillus arenilitoris]|uniref:Alpha/beta hydrolase n=1 Tax=Paenibacillus arenilitoris TaxID=2772299 RepID=A0A927CN51_9BACL|nr:alpha/beta hydrolase [Paenibacillus arenilitoris]MBD2869211.1 alpha/beta hydrolase [Paenibacillus arenilitoris]
MKDELLLWPGGAPYAQGDTDEDRPAITPYLVEGSDRPAVVVCPGGGYGMRAYHEGEPIAQWLNGLGISAFVVRYRVAPYQYPCALLDVQRAIRTVRREAVRFGVDPGRIGLLGFSAGGHLSANAGTSFDPGNRDAVDPIERQSCRPDLLVLCYPVITMKDPFTHQGSRENLLGKDADQAKIVRHSNELNVTKDTPPTFLWHTSNDGAVPVENSLLFASALGKQGVLFDLHVYAKGRHGLGLAEDEPHADGWTDTCASWLKLNGYVQEG